MMDRQHRLPVLASHLLPSASLSGGAPAEEGAAAAAPPPRHVDGRRDAAGGTDDRVKRQVVDVLEVPAQLQREAPPTLLADADVQRFITDGFVLVDADFGQLAMHRHIFDKLQSAFDGNDGVIILPRVPKIQNVYDHPAVRGALKSLLGPDCAMHPNRFRHLRLGADGSQPRQDWHKDGYVFDHQLRSPRPRWVFALYYPQDVTLAQGPTGLLPEAHLHEFISSTTPEEATERAVPLTVQAGTAAIVNFDSWHRRLRQAPRPDTCSSFTHADRRTRSSFVGLPHSALGASGGSPRPAATRRCLALADGATRQRRVASKL
eukprot:SAG11_NODE_6742_length_1256_cov_1.444252_2_plen_319_part_00